jgi:hypothetical protein
MTYQDKLREVAESLGVSFVFQDWTTANIEIDKTPLPAVTYILPTSGSLNFKLGFIKDSQNGMLAFLDKVVLDGDGVDNDNVVDRMKRLAMQYIVKLNATGYFEMLSGVLAYKTIYSELNSNVSGIAFEVTLKEVKGICEERV